MAFKRFFFFHETLDQLKYKQMESSRSSSIAAPRPGLNSSEVFGAQGQGYSQELHNLGQDAVGSSMCCLLPLPLPHLPFHPAFPRLVIPGGAGFLSQNTEVFPQVQGQEATGSAGTCPLPGHRGTGPDGLWELEVMEKPLVFHGRVVLAPCVVLWCLGSAVHWRTVPLDKRF